MNFQKMYHDNMIMLIFLLIQTFSGFFSYLFVKYCCYCSKKVGSSSTIFKYSPLVMIAIQTAILLSYIFLCYFDKLNFNMRIAGYLSMYLFVLPLMTFGLKYCKKIPTVCFGRRVCCPKISKKDLKEMLSFYVDRFIPIRQEVATLQNICMRKGGEIIRYALERRFHESHPVDVLFTGSAFENFGLPISSGWIKDFNTIPKDYPLLTDFDLMLFFDNILASEEDHGDSHFQIRNSTKQGFVMLHVTEYGLRHLSSGFSDLFVLAGSDNANSPVMNAKNANKMLYSVIANTKLDSYPGGHEDVDTRQSKINIAKLTILGPAVQMKVGTTVLGFGACCGTFKNDGFLADFVFGIKTTWPCISDWKDRIGRFWPSPEDVEKIVDGGCHFVAKSQPDDKIGITWRYSFSKAEIELSKLVSPVARKCFLALKMISKDHLQPIAPWLKSYHLKTILYHTLEKTPNVVWNMEKIETCFKLLFENFKTSLENGVCQHYWIPSINLFDKKLVQKRYHFKRISSVLDHIFADPVKYINIFEPDIVIPMNYENQVVRSNDHQELVEIVTCSGSANNYAFEPVDVGDRIELL